MANYSFEKGRYGGPTGAIFPFFRELSGDLPTEQDYDDYVPAGFIKCKGQVLSATQYPGLAAIIGVGEACIYRKEGTTLAEPNQDGSGGTFQLPDLGSKYISASSNPGAYSENVTTNPVTNAEVQRAGVSVSLLSSGNTVDFTYSGEFASPGVSSLEFSGKWNADSPPSKTQETTVAISNFVSHGHRGTFKIGHSINLNSQAMANANWKGQFSNGGLFCWKPAVPGGLCPPDANFGVQFTALEINDAGSESKHSHQLSSVNLVENYSGNIPSVKLSAAQLVTTVNIKTSKIYKMDDIAPKFILCEYLIKY